MINSLYYSFSTIAQTLAGAIGLLGAFVLFRLQSLSAEIESNASQIATVVDMVVGGEEAQTLFRQGQYHEVLNRLGKITVPPTTYQCTRERSRLPILLDRKDSLLWRFKIAFYLTIGLIMASVSVLVIAEQLAGRTSLASVVFALGLLWLAACLASYLSLMLESLK